MRARAAQCGLSARDRRSVSMSVGAARACGHDSTLWWGDGPGSERRLALWARAGPLTIGRREGSSVALPWDAEVSRAHAQLQPVGREWTICDDGLSRNGTWVNGERVSGRRRLSDGDTIRVGRTMLVVALRPSPTSVPTAGVADANRGTLNPGPLTHVRLCGALVFERAGERLDDRLTGRQGRLVFAFLVLHRAHPVRRDQLIDAVWPDRPPKNPQSTLHVIFS